MITQIYSIQTVKEALDCVEAGANFIGISAGSKDNLPAMLPREKGIAIFDAIKGKAKRVALTVADEPEEIFKMVNELQPDIVHICGNQYMATPEFCQEIKQLYPDIIVEQVIAITGPESIAQAIYYSSFCDILVLDSVDRNIAGVGAAGIVNDWNICAEIVQKVTCHVILAGGLGPVNVEEAIKKVKPWGVDSFTNTSVKNKDGSSYKDIQKVKEFIENAKKAGEIL